MDDDALILAGWDDELGAARRARGGRNPRQAMQRLQPDAGGIVLDQLLPFPNGSFTAAIAALTLSAAPQRAFRMRRLVIDFGRVGATATGLVQVTQLTIGADPQFVATGSIPAAMFASTAVGVHLKGNAARPGVTVVLALSVTPAPGAGDTILVSAAATGPSIA